jgi:hypothetical protein
VDLTQNRVAAGGSDGEVRVWNIEDGTLVTRFVAAPGLAVEWLSSRDQKD